jgi:cytochrome P450
MVSNPHIQETAQKELDEVLGPATLPTMADRERLPYIQNLVYEVLRWQPVNPTGKDLDAAASATTGSRQYVSDYA